jgi:hypothetical protein
MLKYKRNMKTLQIPNAYYGTSGAEKATNGGRKETDGARAETGGNAGNATDDMWNVTNDIGKVTDYGFPVLSTSGKLCPRLAERGRRTAPDQPPRRMTIHPGGISWRGAGKTTNGRRMETSHNADNAPDDIWNAMNDIRKARDRGFPVLSTSGKGSLLLR